ncbi:uncharacterized protein LOC122391120 [Amphibalanus amphitrite]|uniref:uncharacterized protein LOC122391120 n=1 Tax=Amphibalanus amphitrite TaxID=1232801 RepID=UPI001C8FF796|nr:uncharacterized protein LOC122391120 [Amphibalanus amphitrite]
MPAVPVKVRYGDGPIVETYAFIDSGSSLTFLSKELLSQLGITTAKKYQLTLTTMAQQPVELHTSAVDNLQMCDMDENEQMQLPEVFVIDKIPVSRTELCKAEDVEPWPHVRDVLPEEIEAEVGLLIGVNVPEAFEPLDFVPSCDGGPFAVKTRLGWVVNGPVRSRKLTEVRATSNRIRLLERQLYQDEGLAADERGWSIEDHMWMEKVEAGCIMKDGHYEVPIHPTEEGGNHATRQPRDLHETATRTEKEVPRPEEEVAFMGDVNSMFHQVSVPADQRDLLRFLWWRNGDPAEDVEVWRMTVHPFGLRSSPSCASYALLRTAVDFGDLHSTAACETISSNIYVDDLVKSVTKIDEAIDLVREVRELCSRGGFHLAKFVSNQRKVLQSIPPEDRGKNVKQLNLEKELPLEKTLGVEWRVNPDVIGFSTTEDRSMPCSRRGMLSVIGSLYDPMGMAAPFVVCGRIILQELTRRRYDWDDPAPEDIQAQWEQWIRGRALLSTISVPRCVQPAGLGPIQTRELHHFADASSVAYGTVSYLRIACCDGRVHCAFVFGKARVLPLNGKLTVPRAELTAATLAARIEATLRRALQVKIDESVFWTDSTTVLRYLQNETTRFHTFVTNRLAVIRDVSSPAQWRYVDSANNPADDASRGQLADNFIANPRWFDAPAFLWKGRDEWPEPPAGLDRRVENDPEMKITSVAVAHAGCDPLEELFSHYSVWYRLVRAVAWILRLKRYLVERCRKVSVLGSEPKAQERQRLTVPELEAAERAIVTRIQRSEFAADLASLEGRGAVGITSPLARLDPYLHDGMIMGPFLNQKMANLPEDRVTPDEPPFTNTGLDMFGVFYVKKGRRQQKRYGIVFFVPRLEGSTHRSS